MIVALCAGDAALPALLRAARPACRISPRALTLTLKSLADARDVVERTVLDTFPATRYGIAGRGRALGPAVRGVLASAA